MTEKREHMFEEDTADIRCYCSDFRDVGIAMDKCMYTHRPTGAYLTGLDGVCEHSGQ